MSELLNKVKNILKVKIGEFVADSTIRVSCKRINVDPENLQSKNIPEFAEKIRISLLLFLNDKEVEDIVNKIKNLKG